MIKNYSLNSMHIELPTKSVERNSVPLTIERPKIEAPNTVQPQHKQAFHAKIEDLRKKTHTPLVEKEFIDEKAQR